MTSANWSGRRVGPYQILQPIGSGGMGAVFRARHLALGVERALKVILEADPMRRGRFLREARHTASIAHPNIIRLHDAGEDQGVAWYAMDLVTGEDLDSMLRRGRLPLDTALRIMIQTAEGVAALHAHGVVHRDLKPQNVMVTPDGRALVIDLGLAVAPEQDERLTRTGAAVGTLAYMSPEQLLGERATARSDVYALGLILYELLTGFAAREDSAAALSSALAAPRATEKVPDLPHAVDVLLDRALAVQPADRFADAAELVGALRGLRDRPGWSRRAMRRAIVGVAAAALLVLVLGVALFSATRGATESAPGSSTLAASGPPAGAAPAPAPERLPLTSAELQDGDSQWRAMKRLAAADQLAACEAWLRRFPAHPRTADVQELSRAARLRVPLASIEGINGIAVRGARLVTSGGSGRAQIWELGADGLEEVLHFDLPGSIEEIGVLGPSRLVAVTRRPDQLVVVEAEDGRELMSVPIRHDPRSLAVSPDGGWAAVGFLSGGLTLVQLGSDHFAAWNLLPGHKSADARALTFSPDSRSLYVGNSEPPGEFGLSNNNAVYRYEVAKRALKARQPMAVSVNALTCRPDGTAVYAGLMEGLLLRLDPHTLAEEAQLDGRVAEVGLAERFDRRVFAHRSGVRGVHALSDGRLLSVSGDDQGVRPNEFRLWGRDDRELHQWLALPYECHRLAVSVEGGWFAVRYRSGRVDVWALPDR